MTPYFWSLFYGNIIKDSVRTVEVATERIACYLTAMETSKGSSNGYKPALPSFKCICNTLFQFFDSNGITELDWFDTPNLSTNCDVLLSQTLIEF